MTIFELLSEYHERLDLLKGELWRESVDQLDRIGIADAWQSEMEELFRRHGFCFACNRPLGRCCCGGDA